MGVPLLLKALNSGMGMSGEGVPKFAPWTWTVTSALPDLATELSEELVKLGVRSELSTILTASVEEDEIAADDWARFVGSLTSILRR